jgi:hypothetical protein
LQAGYFAAAACAQLPAARRGTYRVVERGWAVGIGQWFFFSAPEPAAAFGWAARMSVECSGYGVYEAARETLFCDRHGTAEVALLVDPRSSLLARSKEDQLALLTRFVQGVAQHPGSAHWHQPVEAAGPGERAAETAPGRGCRARLNDGRACQLGPRPSGLCHIHDPVAQCGAPTLTGGRCTRPTGGGPCRSHA